MARRFLYFIFLLLCAFNVSAQGDLKEKMNTIKLDPEYYWGEATSDTRETATADATVLLLETIAADGLTVTEKQIEGNTEFLFIPRGERTRAFAYIKKALVGLGNVTVTPQPSPQEVVTPAVPPPPAPIPAVTQPSLSYINPANTTTCNSTIGTSALMIISQCEMISDVWRCLGEFRKEGGINDCGKVTSRTQLEENNYLVIYDDDNVVKAILAPANGLARKNITTGNDDDMKNYRGCRVIWFR